MSFMWFNLNDDYHNGLISYGSDNGSTFSDIAFPPGVWNYEDFDKYIQEEVGDDSITLEFGSITFKVTIKLKKNYQLDGSKSNFNTLIGFNKVVLKDEVNVGERTPNLSQDTDIINIHRDLVNDSLVDGEETDIIYSFSTSILA